jgi:hypothetical protein
MKLEQARLTANGSPFPVFENPVLAQRVQAAASTKIYSHPELLPLWSIPQVSTSGVGKAAALPLALIRGSWFYACPLFETKANRADKRRPPLKLVSLHDEPERPPLLHG